MAANQGQAGTMTGGQLTVEQVLVKRNIITFAQLNKAIEHAERNNITVVASLLRLDMCTQADVSRAIAAVNGLKFADLDKVLPTAELLSFIPAEMVIEKNVFPVLVKDGTLFVGMAEPDIMIADDIMFVASGKGITQVKIVIVEPDKLHDAINENYGKKEMERITAEATAGEEGGPDDVTRIAAEGEDAPIISYTRGLIERAVKMRASDIRIEPFEKRVLVRFRIDDILVIIEEIPMHIKGAVISRFKIMAGMDIAERRQNQDGRIRVEVFGRDIDIRVSLVPTTHGENIVMRILDKEKALVDLEELGFHESDFLRFQTIIKRPNGIFLVTGPTGSGKTTTLYAALKKLNLPNVNIMTAENPVEYLIPGINQSEVKTLVGLTFASILRAMMRQAPNIILIGEIRDRETAEIATQAALTGHLVFSTLHTNDAPSAITRLIDMGVKPFLVSTALMAVMAQRLVRVLCKECKQPYDPTDNELKSIGLPREDIGASTIYMPAGCKECNGSGYRGRKGIFELMEMSSDLRKKAFYKKPVHEIRASAEREGMINLQQDAVRKVLTGMTSIAEVIRVTSEVA